MGVLGQGTLVAVSHGAGEAGGSLEVEGAFGRTHFVRVLTRPPREDLVASRLATASALLGVRGVTEETTRVLTGLGGTEVLLKGVGEGVGTLVDTELSGGE